MPGKSPSSASYNAVSAPKLYRTVNAAESALAGVPVLRLDVTERLDAKGNPIPVSIGASNRLAIGVLLGDGVVSAEVAVFVDLVPTDSVLAEDPTWEGGYAEVSRGTYAKSSVVELDGIYPGSVKILVTALTGAGNVYLVYSRTE